MTLRVKQKKYWWVWVLGGLLFAVLCVTGWFLWLYLTQTPKGVETIKEPPAPHITEITSNSLFMGNIYWGRYTNDRSQASELKTAYPFSRLHEFNRESYQNWIAGLECPLVAGVHLTSAQEEATLSFNCSPDYLPEAAKWFNVVTLANNHTDNQGVEGFAETKRHLDEYNIQYFGHYDPRALDDLCGVISLNVVAKYSDGTTQPAQLPVAMCGYHGVFRIPTQESLAVMEKYSQIMPVIAFPHTGAEYQPAPDQIKTDLYRSMIDHGADMVLGDHPHWIQTTEAYKGKLIVYSMGNFMFDQQFNSEVTRSAAIRVLMSATGDSDDLAAWTMLAKACTTYHDTCLQDIEQQSLPKLDFTYRYQVIGTSNVGYLAYPANETQQQEILQRLQWSQTMNGLQPPHAAL